MEDGARLRQVLDRCEEWNDGGEYRRIVDALEALPEDRGAEADSVLARAYNNLAVFGDGEPSMFDGGVDRGYLERALGLLLRHADEMSDDPIWNFRTGYSLYYLDREGEAMPYFRRYLDHDPEDADTQELLEACIHRTACPVAVEPFSSRVGRAWSIIANMEDRLRAVADGSDGNGVMEHLERALSVALVDFDCGVRREDGVYELVLGPRGRRHMLFPLVRFAGGMPESLAKDWRVVVGRPGGELPEVDVGGRTIACGDVRVAAYPAGTGVRLVVSCPPLAGEEDAEGVLADMTSRVIGDVTFLCLSGFDVADDAGDGSFPLTELPGRLDAMGSDIPRTAEAAVTRMGVYSSFAQGDGAPRDDIVAGSTCMPELVACYADGDTEIPDRLHRMGAEAGFVWFPAGGFADADEATGFRNTLQSRVSDAVGDGVTFIGGAVGTGNCYLDFLAWDLSAVLDAFAENLGGIGGVFFRTFRGDVPPVPLAAAEDPDALFPDDGDPLVARIEDWNSRREYTRCAEEIESTPGWESDYRLRLLLARAYGNSAVRGDWDYRRPSEVDGDLGAKALGILDGIADEGAGDVLWWRVRAGLLAGLGDTDGAAEAAVRGLGLDPDDRHLEGLLGRLGSGEPLEKGPYTGSCRRVLTPEQVGEIEGMFDDVAGSFWAMRSYILDIVSEGVSEGRFTEAEAWSDPELSMWFAYACINLETYGAYFEAAVRMPAAIRNARGCGTWFYRLSCALTHIGRQREAMEMAELGAREEPDYPWVWLQVSKLRAHFGDADGAREAAERGLELVPGDHEFGTLLTEIEEGASLEAMNRHWIDPASDDSLQSGDIDGRDREQADEMEVSLRHLVTDPEGLRRVEEAVGVPVRGWASVDDPYCSVELGGCTVVFRMNRAAVSKMGTGKAGVLAAGLSGGWDRSDDGMSLETVVVEADMGIGLVYSRGDESLVASVSGDGTVSEPETVSDGDPVVYTDEELEAVRNHIQRTIGPFENVFHEIRSPDVRIDICVVPPREGHDYYTLVTMGVGARRMNVPPELADSGLGRAELLINLPRGWGLDMESFDDEAWFWPLRLLKVIGRMPIENDTWIGLGHTFSIDDETFADGTDLCGSILLGTGSYGEEAGTCRLPDGEAVEFYQVVPLYREEVQYKLEHGAGELLELFNDELLEVVDPLRLNVVTDGDLVDSYGSGGRGGAMDTGARHAEKIAEKGLAVPEIAAYSHMAVFLRWCIERRMVSRDFEVRHRDMVTRVRELPSDVDLREYIRDRLGGALLFEYLDDEGRGFAEWYYDGGDPSYTGDVDRHAAEYFGERSGSEEFADEEYLFVPFDEDYYRAMSDVIDGRLALWRSTDGRGRS